MNREVGTRALPSQVKHDGLATLFSFLCPGLGHIYLGAILRGVGMIVVMLLIIQSAIAAHRDDLFWQRLLVSEIQLDGNTNPASMRQSMLATYWFLGSLLAAALWWIWGMVSARRLAQRLNSVAVTCSRSPGTSD